jgi:hypothetical protein
MMKPVLDPKTGQVEGFAFEHAAEKIRATEHLLLSFLGLERTKDTG